MSLKRAGPEVSRLGGGGRGAGSGTARRHDGSRHGSTLRVFEPASAAWQTVWTDPVSGLRIELLGRRQGDDIVQIGTRGGRPIRWIFSQIRADSFVWQGHILNVDGKTWDLEVDIQFRRSEG